MRFRWEVAFYVAVFLLVLFMSINGYSKILTIGVGMGAALIAFIIHYFYPLALEKRMDRVESFLRSQKNTPELYIHYVLANRFEDESRMVMEQIMSKHKKEKAQAVYKAAYGVYRKDMNDVREAVPYIRFSDYRAYYETILLSEDEKSTQARECLKSIKKRWMRSALLAEIEIKAGRRETAIKHAREAVNASRGVHRYVLHKEYERILPEAIASVS
ncbi:hypothetical protein [Paenibacillus illinoisensis]|uniref:hypothetical protein n=1 Tax=Paenibacillus illinoisensis TaxID=59845 RepID=UPI001C8D103E|nr:hypothetical protein [Paenibacillus illinoisensis]MBY0217857.1 hypothetical protein [Paenibacillus illinoisensis]